MSNFFYTNNEHGELLKIINVNLLDAKEYNFATAYFDFRIINEYFTSFEVAIENGAEIRFIFSKAIDKNEFLTVKHALNNEWVKFSDFSSVSMFNEEQKMKLFNWIKNGNIIFRVAFVDDENPYAIFHSKVGYILKRNGKTCEWSGSANHTYNGLIGINEEHYSIDHFDSKNEIAKYFDSIWNSEKEKLYVVDVDKVLITELGLSTPNLKIDVDWILDKFNKVIFKHNDKIIFYDNEYENQEEIPHYNLPESYWKISDGLLQTNASDVNKLQFLSQLNDYYGYGFYISPSLESYLNDNILKIEGILKTGNKIKNEWETILDSDDYRSFVNSISIMKRKPFPLQIKQAYFAVNIKKSLNFSVPGTGKSMVTLTAFHHLRRTYLSNRLFILAPTAAHSVWEEEYFEAFGVKPKVINLSNLKISNKDERHRVIGSINNHNYDIVIMHFASATINYFLLREIVRDMDYLVVDEAHYIKNMEGKWGTTIKNLGKLFDRSIILTGTPSPNGINDTKNILEITYGNDFIDYFESSNNQALLINSLHVRIDYNDLEMKWKQKNKIVKYTLYNEQVDEISLINDKLKKLINPASFFETFTKRHQALTSLKLLQKESFDIDESPKLQKLMECIESNKNIVIWANYINSITSIEQMINTHFPSIKTYTYNGQSTIDDRIVSIEQYKEEGGILIANPQSLAEAVSLHKCTDYTIYFEYDLNLVHWMQSRNRTFRYGINNDMEYIILMATNDNLEEYILEKLTSKEKFQDTLLEKNVDTNIEVDIINDIKKYIDNLI